MMMFVEYKLLMMISSFVHHDIVVSMMITNYDVKKFFVDNESSINVLFYSIFFQMRPPTDRLKKVSMPLVSFTGERNIQHDKKREKRTRPAT